MTKYGTRYKCPYCKIGGIWLSYTTNHWTDIRTPFYWCDNCNYEILPKSKEQQNIFNQLLELKKGGDD